MPDKNDELKPPEKTSKKPPYVGLGLIFGVVFGSAVENMGLGIALGVAIGIGMDSKKSKKDGKS